jgi:uncharacterized iron-regulated membrane protein
MRRAFLVAHRCIGLASAVFLVCLSLTGAVMAFENEFNRIINPQLLKVQPQGQPLPWETVRRRVEASDPAWRVQRIYMPAADSDSTYVRLVSRSSAVTREIYVDQYTGRILGRKELANQLVWKIHDLHISLGAGAAGSQIVFMASIALLCLAISGIYLWWPRRIFSVRSAPMFSRVNYDLHRALGFWLSIAMAAFAVTGINLHLQTGGGLFAMMDAKSTPIDLPGHGVTADGMLQSAAEALPGARLMRISFWGGKRAVLVQMRFPEDKTPAGRSAVTLDPQTGRVFTVVSSRTAPLLYTALVEWNREIHTGVMFGAPTQAVVCVLSFLLSILALSGAWIWINSQIVRGAQASNVRTTPGEAGAGRLAIKYTSGPLCESSL